jgi:FK506-binding protein 15
MDRASQLGGNEALTYTAPKEPKKKTDANPANPPPTAPAVLTAFAVFAYKYGDNKYASQGKLGAAVIGSHAAGDYKVLLYYTKEKPVTFARISSSFSFLIQPNNYATFYDDTQQNWSIMFDSESNVIQFTKQVAAAKANCQAAASAGKLDSLVVQDLVLGEGGTLETGDSVEMKYTGYLFTDNAIGTMFETNASADKLLRFRLGKSKTIKAFDEGIVGMRKNGKRLLVAPPSMAFGSEGKQGKVPPDAVTVFEVEIVRVKLAREPASDVTPAVTTSGSTETHESQEEDDTKARRKSSTDHPPPPVKSDKAKLISRMAKMGQSMLPPMNQLAVDTGDSKETSSVVSSPSPVLHHPDMTSKPIYHHPSNPQHLSHSQVLSSDPVPVVLPGSQIYQPMNSAFQGSAPSSQLAVFQPQPFLPQMAGFPPYQMPQFSTLPYANPSQMYQPPVSQPVPAATVVPDSNLPMMLMEARQQNTEVRVSLSKISDKVDRLMEKFDQANVRQTTALSLTTSMPSMEVGMLVHTVEKIVSENERLKKELLENSGRIEAQNSKINELLQRNQMYVEQSNAMLEQRNDSFKSTAVQSQARVMSLEQEKVELAMRLSQASSQLADSQLELASLKKSESELKQQLERLVTMDAQGRDELGSLRVQLTDCSHQLEQTGAQLRDEQTVRKQLQTQVNDLQETVSELRNSRDTAEKSLADRKRKMQEEVSRLEAEMEELRTSHEREMSTLRDRLKHEKNSTELTTAQQLSQVEEQLNVQWKDKCDRMLNSAQDKHQRELDELNAERHQLEDKVSLLEAKVRDMKAARDSNESQVDALRDELDQLRTWKDKYDSLRTQAVTMKQRYEQRIVELDEERTNAEQEKERLELELSRMVDAGRRLQAQLTAATTVASGANGTALAMGVTTENIQAEVKKVMNAVYRSLRAEFLPETVYSGSEINAVVLNVIKTVTLEMMQGVQKNADDVSNERGMNQRPTDAAAVTDSHQQNPEPVTSKTDVLEAKFETTSVISLQHSVKQHQVPDDSTVKQTAVALSPEQLHSDDMSTTVLTDVASEQSELSVTHFEQGLCTTEVVLQPTATHSDGTGRLLEEQALEEVPLQTCPVEENVLDSEQVHHDANILPSKEHEVTVDKAGDLSLAQATARQVDDNVQPVMTDVVPEAKTPVEDEVVISTMTAELFSPPSSREDMNKDEMGSNVDSSSDEKYTSDFGSGDDRQPYGDASSSLGIVPLNSAETIMCSSGEQSGAEEIFASPAGSEQDFDDDDRRTADAVGMANVDVTQKAEGVAPLLDTEPPLMDSDYEETSTSNADEGDGAIITENSKHAAAKVELGQDMAAVVVPRDVMTLDNEEQKAAPSSTAKQPSSAVKAKQVTSIFGDDDDDDDLFGLSKVPGSRFATPPASRATPQTRGNVSSSKIASATGSSVKKVASKTDIDEDANRKPPPLFNDDSDDDVDWLK